MAKSILSELKHMPEKMEKAELAAVKKTQKTARTRISKGFRDVVNLKKDMTDDRVRTIRNPRRGNAYAVIRVSKYQISLWEYSHSKADLAGFANQAGIKKYRTSEKTGKRLKGKWKGRKPAKGAGWKIYKGGKIQRNKRFIATKGKKGQPIIIKRTPGSTKGGKQARAPRDYRTAYGPSLVWIDERRNVVRPVLDELAPVLEKNMRSQVDRFLGRKKSQRTNA